MLDEKRSINGNSAKALLVLALLASFGAMAAALPALSDFTTKQFVMAAVGMVIAWFASQHRIAIPNTTVILSPAELSVFCGCIWLGIPGAVLFAAGAAAPGIQDSKSGLLKRLFDGSVLVTAAFVVSNVFYFVLDRLAGFKELSVADSGLSPLWLVAGLLPAAGSGFLVNAVGRVLYASVANDGPKPGRIAFQLVSIFVSLVGALLVHSLFLSFGPSFGWVILAFAAVGHLAYRIHVDRLAQKVKQIGEASRVHLATVEALATAIDARDQVGRGHVRRTQIYAVGIGELLGLKDEDIQALRTGALLHDIGKLAVPDHILNKPGRLTPAEMEKIKIHAPVGAAILEAIGFANPVIPTIKHHHESWDGTGYPDGLKGKNIPHTARILAVADAYDTLRGARPYRAPVTRDEARRFLINGAGSQFDPTVVDVFCRNLSIFEDKIAEEGLSYAFDSDSEAASFKTDADTGRSYIEQIKKANREVFTLYELARTFSATLSIESVYSLFASKIRELVPFDTFVIYRHNEITDEAQAVYAEGANDAEIRHIYIKSGEGGSGFALKKRQAVASNLPNLDFSFSQVTLTYEYSAMASLPLIVKEKLLGAVSIYSCSLSEYEDEHLRLLETVSRIASDAIYKSISHAETESRALTDPMTGLPNARSLQIQFEKESARSDRNDAKFQVLMLDLDGFKAVNDTFGHKVGDRFLKEVSKVMRGQLRDYDFLARYAGDEFVAIIPETDNRTVKDLCERIEKAVTNFVLPIGDGRFARVGISVGAASYPAGGKMLDQLLIAADKAMYEVKVRRKRLRLASESASRKPSAPPQAAGPPESSELPALAQPSPAQQPPAASPAPEHVELASEDLIVELQDENFLVELDESHIVSNAIN